MDPCLPSIGKETTTLDSRIGGIRCEEQWGKLIEGRTVMLLVLPMKSSQLTSCKVGSGGSLPGNQPSVLTETSAMVNGIMGSEQHLIGQSEVVLLSHWR